MLHIHNGDASADSARLSDIPGEHFAFRESLITGPAPAGLTDSDWRDLRARHLSDSYDIEVEDCKSEMLAQEERFHAAFDEDEIVLWFEHDLFCQVHLIYLLGLFGSEWLRGTRPSLVCINSFPGKPNFRGLGELKPEELATLFPKRVGVTEAQLELATVAWKAFTSPDPTAIQTLIAGDTSALPFLGRALRAHLSRFPSTANGLGAIENEALLLINQGENEFRTLFKAFCDAQPVFGLGDAQLWMSLKRLAEAASPALKMSSSESQTDNTVAPEASFELTAAGKEVLEGSADFVALNGIDMWLGGVHLDDRQPSWRWDSEHLVNRK